MRPIRRCMNAKLADICQQAVKLDELNDKIKKYLPEPLADFCKAGAFTRGSLVLTTTNAAWATELRYCVPELRDKLRAAGLYQLISIKITVAEAEHYKPIKSLHKTTLSAKARDNIKNASELCNYQPLKDALYQLAHSEDNSGK